MGRARGGLTAITGGARFDAAVGQRRGSGPGTPVIASTMASPLRDLHADDAEVRMAGARALREDLESGELSSVQRAVVWGHVIGLEDRWAREEVLGGLVAQLREDTASEADINHALVFLAAAGWDPKTATGAGQVEAALAEHFAQAGTVEIEVKGAMLEAYETAPASPALAGLVADHISHDNNFRLQLMDTLASLAECDTHATLGVMYAQRMRGDYYDEQWLRMLAQAHPDVRPNTPMAAVVSGWAGAVNSKSQNIVDAAWAAVAAGRSGYEPLEDALLSSMPDSLTSDLSGVLHTDGQLTRLGEKMLKSLAANPDAKVSHWKLGPALAELDALNRARPDVVAVAAKVGADVTQTVERQAEHLLQRITRDEAPVPSEAVADLSRRVGERYREHLLAGENPEPAVFEEFLGEASQLFARFAAEDHRLLKTVQATNYEFHRNHSSMAKLRVRRAFGDPDRLAEAYVDAARSRVFSEPDAMSLFSSNITADVVSVLKNA